MSFSHVSLFLLFTFLPPEVQDALDKLMVFDNVRMQFVRHTNDPTSVQDARTFYMRNRQGQELVITEAPTDDQTRRITTRMLMRDGMIAMSCDLAPVFQVTAADTMGRVAGASPELLMGSGTLSGMGHVPTLPSFHLRGRLKPENIQQVTVERDGAKEVYHILTNLQHEERQTGSSILTFVYDQASGRILETWIRTGERCRIGYDDNGRIKKLSTVYPGHPHQDLSWDILLLDTEDVVQELDWRWIGLVPGCQVMVSMPEHHTYGSMARWTGDDMVTMEEYRNLAATGQVVSDPEYHHMMAEATALGEKSHLIFEKAMEAFEFQFAQTTSGKACTPWEHLTRKFCEEFSLSDERRKEAEKACREATERLRKFAGEYNEKRPEVGLLTLMTFSQHAIESSQLSEETKSDRKKSEALKKARDLFLRFWEELRKGQPESAALKAWDQRFEYAK